MGLQGHKGHKGWVAYWVAVTSFLNLKRLYVYRTRKSLNPRPGRGRMFLINNV
jgi:hypothetical protein